MISLESTNFTLYSTI